jgi:ribose 5-phosphate isomerase A
LKPEEDWIEEAKRNAASEAAKHIRDNFVIGLGSGSTAAYAIHEIGNRIEREEMHVLAVPTSHQSFTLAIDHGIPITTLQEHPTLDLTIDGADQIDSQLNLIKGMGGALTREKIVASASKTLIIIADKRKKVSCLGENDQPVPIEIVPFAAPIILRKIEQMRGKPTIREGNRKVGPVITDNGNFIIDANLGDIHNPEKMQQKLKSLSGVVETGLFANMAGLVYIGEPCGVKKMTEKGQTWKNKE